MPSLSDVPVEVFIDNLLPFLTLKDILVLTSVSKAFAALCSDDTFWKRKLKEDYNFSDTSSARNKGYKFLYKGVHNAKLYVWGSAGEGRLGLSNIQPSWGILSGSRPYPTRLKVSTPRIVELAAAGWSFHALDSEGYIHVWGQLDGAMFGLMHNDPFSNPTKRASSPKKLILPERMTKIGCGRSHAVALSSTNRIWTFTSWGRPYVLTTPFLSTSSTFTTPSQVECGWSFSAVLTNGGEVYVWWPFDGEFGDLDRFHREQSDENPDNRVQHSDETIQCVPWEVHNNPHRIPDITSTLPKLRGEYEEVGEKIVKIAAGDNFLIGLTEGGHVLRLGLPNGHASFNDPLRRPRWEYLERYSELRHLRVHPTFNPENADIAKTAPDAFQVTHVSAHFKTFFAYSTGSSSVVLRGSNDTLSQTEPDIPPSLQNRGVISVVLGDYHFGALTSTGKLLTWGAYSSGALGLGDPTQLPAGSPGGYLTDAQREISLRSRIIPPDVTEPTEVKFGTRNGGKGRESFVFNATASGWHTGALVIDLEDNDDLGDEEPAESHRRSGVRDGRGPSLPFRIGLTGLNGLWGTG